MTFGDVPSGSHAGPPAAADHLPEPCSPWWILATLAALAMVAGLGRLPAPATAGLVLLLFGGAALRHPGNGLAALVLASPFFLGEYKTPYFLVEYALVGMVLLSFLVQWGRGRLACLPVCGGPALLFVAAAVIALPLNLRDLLEDLWLVGSLDWSLLFQQGIPDISHLKYLERILVLGLGVALFTVAAQPAILPSVVGTLRPLAVLLAGLTVFGLLRFFGVIRTAGQYLTLSFGTWQNPDLRLTAVAWNPDYFAQWLVLALPLVVALVLVEGPRWQRGLLALAAAAGALALLFTFQRAGYLALVVALGLLALLAGRTRSPRGVWGGALLALGALVVVVGAGVDLFVLHGRLAQRLGGFARDPHRPLLWDTALRMARDHPLLGVGTGRYAFFFQEYADPAGRLGFGPFWGTAHSTYLHVLAEQGLLGLVSLLGFFGGVWLGAVRGVRRLADERAMILSGILAALGGWLVYGLVQFVFRVNAIFYLGCVLAGAAAALARPRRRPARPRWWVLTVVAVMAGLLVLRADAALRRPVSPGYEAGFHRWEPQADGRRARWTRGRAAWTTPVGGRILELRLGAPIPGIEGRPQVVRVLVDRQPAAEVRLTAPDWQTVDVPVEAPRGVQVLVELEVAYTFVPGRLTGSRDDRKLGVMVGDPSWRDA